MRARHNRLTTTTDSVVSVKADTNFRSALEFLVARYGARGQAEIIYQSVFLLANQLGYETPLGGRLPTLEHLAEVADQTDKQELEKAVVSGVPSRRLTQSLLATIENAVLR